MLEFIQAKLAAGCVPVRATIERVRPGNTHEVRFVFLHHWNAKYPSIKAGYVAQEDELKEIRRVITIWEIEHRQYLKRAS